MKITQILPLLCVAMLGSAVRLSLVRSIPNRNFGGIGGDVVGDEGDCKRWCAAGGCGMVMVLFGLVAILVCMQDMGGNEKSTGLVGRIRERIRDWEFRHPLIARPFWYFALLVVVLGVCHCVFDYFNLYHTDADSARYMLSAMVQAQAAIVAIVITLTLIAVQLTASVYSPRVIDIFKKNPDMWILLGCYGVSILYGFTVLKMVEGAEGEVVSQDIIRSLGYVPISFESCVSFAYWLEAFTLVALFPYMLNVINLLKSENIIDKLAVRITNDRILNSKEDPIQPIMDMIYGSVGKYDLETARFGLKTVTDRVIRIIDLEREEEISMRFCGHFGRVGRLTVRKTDEVSTVEVIINLGNFGKLVVEKGFGGATSQAIGLLGGLGTLAAENGLGIAAGQAAESIRDIGKIAKEKEVFADAGVEFIMMLCLNSIKNSAAEKGLKEAESQARKSIEEILKTAPEKEF